MYMRPPTEIKSRRSRIPFTVCLKASTTNLIVGTQRKSRKGRKVQNWKVTVDNEKMIQTHSEHASSNEYYAYFRLHKTLNHHPVVCNPPTCIHDQCKFSEVPHDMLGFCLPVVIFSVVLISIKRLCEVQLLHTPGQ